MNAIVTGATKGMGRAIVMELAANNYNITFCARDENQVEAFLDETLTFGQMFDLVAEVLDDDWSAPCIEIEEVLRQDARARQKANGIRKGRK